MSGGGRAALFAGLMRQKFEGAGGAGCGTTAGGIDAAAAHARAFDPRPRGRDRLEMQRAKREMLREITKK